MIRKSRIIATLLVASIATPGGAAYINHDGIGQVALLPYYGVNNNNITNINIFNTTNLFKAVKLRFRESRISADVFNLNLYLSPYDVWNGTIRLNPATGVPNLITEDESCTLPSSSQLQAGIDFSNSYDATSNDDLSEGYIEIIEMGVIADGPGETNASDGDKYAEIDKSGIADGVISEGDRSITAGLIHGEDGIPLDCTVIEDAWSAGSVGANINGFESGSLSVDGMATSGSSHDPYDSSLNAGLVYDEQDRGGINAYAILVNIASGAAFVESATHIDGYSTLPQHYHINDSTSSQLPSLASGNITQAYMVDEHGGIKNSGTLSLTEWDTGALSDNQPNPSTPKGSNPFPIAVVLSADSVGVPFFTEAGLNGSTEIVATFPMRHHGIYNGSIASNQVDQTIAKCDGEFNDGIDDGASVAIPNLDVTAYDYPSIDGVYCDNAGFIDSVPDVEVALAYNDYESQSGALINPNDYLIVNPILIDPLNRSVNVIKIQSTGNGSASVLGTPVDNAFNWQLDAGFKAGWARILFNGYHYNIDPRIAQLTEINGGITDDLVGLWTGVPVIGFTVMTADVGASQSGEAVDLIRFTNRRQ
ncbi:MAG: hypothetical protein JAY62_07080 [Candidatus Thiodiazotropha endolucinida]|nr:hypothetical protein [Candidatus Thiodiazotropha taylori]MCW4274869.1 hypothetical protein [Candidatus Thiodiazotropha taylori]